MVMLTKLLKIIFLAIFCSNEFFPKKISIFPCRIFKSTPEKTLFSTASN